MPFEVRGHLYAHTYWVSLSMQGTIKIPFFKSLNVLRNFKKFSCEGRVMQGSIVSQGSDSITELRHNDSLISARSRY